MTVLEIKDKGRQQKARSKQTASLTPGKSKGSPAAAAASLITALVVAADIVSPFRSRGSRAASLCELDYCQIHLIEVPRIGRDSSIYKRKITAHVILRIASGFQEKYKDVELLEFFDLWTFMEK
jgi:hypothetical protein